jgi:methionine-rich copper-binding protein CopC
VLKYALVALFSAEMVLSMSAFGHAKLAASTPANHAQLMEAPKTLTLTFDEAAQLASLVLVTAGKDIPVALDRTSKAATVVTVPLPALAAGNYEVKWSALAADDGHVSKGSFTFALMGPMTMPH